MRDVPRDVERTAFVPMRRGNQALVTDRLLFRYVLCGPSRTEAATRLRRVVYRREGGKSEHEREQRQQEASHDMELPSNSTPLSSPA